MQGDQAQRRSPPWPVSTTNVYGMCVCFLFSPLFWVGVARQQAVPLFSSVSASLSCRCLENWDLSTAFWEWTGNPNHSLSLSVASFSCGMMVLLHAVHISNCPASSPTYLENFIILCNSHSVFVRIFSSLPLFCPLEQAATVAEMSALSDTADCKIQREFFW